MTIGPLRHRLLFENPVPNRNPDGQNIQGWNEVATVWADVRGISGKQLALNQANTITATATHAIYIRFRSDLSVLNRISQISTFQTECLSGLTLDQLAALTLDELADLELDASATVTKRFRINSMVDPDGRRRQLNILATEVAA